MAKANLETTVKVNFDYSELEFLFAEYTETLSHYKTQRYVSDKDSADKMLAAFLVWLKGKK